MERLTFVQCYSSNMRGALLLLASISISALAQPTTGAYRESDSGVTAPQALDMIAPDYSDEARVAELEGTVFLTGVIDADGAARDMRVTQSLGLGLDEKALEAVERWRFAPGMLAGRPVAVLTKIGVDFLIPSKPSYWHLIGAKFQAAQGVTRPVFLGALYPPGSIVGPSASDEARMVQAMGRKAMVTISFDVDEHGRPVNVEVQSMSDAAWGGEAIELVRYWQFKAGTKDGHPVSVPCALNLVWGEGSLTAQAVANLTAAMNPQPSTVLDRTAPTIIYKTEPGYSDEAAHAGIKGTVTVALTVGEDGIPRDLHVVRSLGFGLDEKAIEAVKQWRFQPARVNGQPTPVPATIEVNFRLPAGGEAP